MCDPTTTILSLSPSIVAHRFPATSRSTVASVSASLESSHSRAVRQSSLHASRRAPSGPPVSSASSCRSLSGRSQSKSGMRRDDRRNSGGRAGFLSRMIRWRRIIGVSLALFALHTGTAAAASPYARAVLVSCDREQHEAVFEGRVVTVKRAAKMQLRFTLQVSTPDDPRWRKVVAPTWGGWITVPPSFGKYTYSKTVQDLLAPANYRALVNFRWKDRKGRTIRSERAISQVCKQPDTRPDLVVRDLKFENGQYVATIFNRGRDTAAGQFAVDFIVDGQPLGTVEVVGLAPQTALTAMFPGGRCALGTPIEAVVDPRSEVDEADEENDSLSAFC